MAGPDISPNGNADPAAPPVAAEPTPEHPAVRELAELRGRLGNLTSYLDRTDGDTIASAVSSYLGMKQDPRTAPLVAKYEQGTLAAPAEPEGEEYLTPEQREIREVRAELQRLRGGQDELVLGAGQQALEGHFARFTEEYPLEPGELAAVRKHLEKSFEGWMKEGETGRRALRNIQSPSNYKMVKNLMLGAIAEVAEPALLAFGARRDQRRSARVEGFRTDDRTTPASDEAMPEFKGANAALQALEFVRKHPERNPHRNRY